MNEIQACCGSQSRAPTRPRLSPHKIRWTNLFPHHNVNNMEMDRLQNWGPIAFIRGSERMNKFVKTFLIVASTSFFLFWVSWALLMVALPPISAWQFFGFSPAPPPSYWQSFVVFVFVAVSMPMSIMYEIVHHDNSGLLFGLLSLANSVVWGLCVGSPIYAIKRRFFTRAV